MNLFNKKKDVKEELKEQNKVLRSSQRELDRDRAHLEREKKRIELEIKKMAKEGNKQACVVLAKQLVQVRKQEERSMAASSRITGIKMQSQIMASNVKLGEAMKSTTSTMSTINKLNDPTKMAQTMKEFEKQNMQMAMTDEMINETLDGVLEGSDDEEQSNQIVNQVLDEIGIEITGKMLNAPTPGKGSLATTSNASKNQVSDAEIEDILSKLKA